MARLAVTRILNASVLIEIDGASLLTDPFFEPKWPLRVREPVGLRADRLPKLAAILGGHRAPDHWQPSSLARYPFKDATPVFVPAESMARSARRAGFQDVEVLAWGDTRSLDHDVSVTAVQAQNGARLRANGYLLSSGPLRVFVGTEARDLEPLQRFRDEHGPVDVALLPIDGSSLAGHPLVMDPRGALAASRVLGVRVLIPIHYAVMPVPPLLRTPGTLDDLLALAQKERIAVEPLEPGRRWTLDVS